MSKKDDFVHLHVHTDNSVLDGHGTVKELVEEVVRLGQPGVGITDHGNLHGAYDLYKTATEAGIIPVIGIEAYFTPSTVDRFARQPAYFADGGKGDVSGRGAYTHLTLLAENNIGLKNLNEMVLKSHTEGFYQKNRIDLDLLSKYNKGIIATTGCPSGEVQTRLRLGQAKEALEFAAKLQDILGKENLFLELMDHEMSIDLERSVRSGLLEIAKKLKMPLVATNDLHYVKKSHAKSHEEMLAVQTRDVMSNLPDYTGKGSRFAFEGQEYYLKSLEEMRVHFSDLPEALSNTLLIAERSNITITPDDTLRPTVNTPNGMTEAEYIRREGFIGLAKRLPEKVNDPIYIDRLNSELDIIEMKNYTGYFLVVSDFVRWGKFEAQPPVPTGFGRGCLSADTQVITPLGFKPITQIKPGDQVYDHTGQTITVTETFEYDCQEPLIEIISYNGHKGNKMTHDHKVLVSKPIRTKKGKTTLETPTWIPAEEIKIGDYVVNPNFKITQPKQTIKLSSVEIPADYNTGKVLGLLIGNGVIPEQYKNIPNYKLIKNNLTELLTKLFDETGKIKHQLPLDLTRYNKDFNEGLAQGIYQHSINHKHKNNHRHERLKTKSKLFANHLYVLLTSIGLQTKVHETNNTYTITTAKNLNRKHQFATGYSDENYTYSRVKTINQVPAENKVYDFTVPGNHSYLTDSYAVHNSAAGSLLGYCLDITDVDPIKYDLLFERFINPERDSPPDIDMDFNDTDRERVIEYVKQKYGNEQVAQIATFGKIGAKAALKDSTRILEKPYSTGDALSKALPEASAGHAISLADVYTPSSERYGEAGEFRALVGKLASEDIVEVSRGFEGRIRSTGVHAAALVVSTRPVVETVPMMVRQTDGARITQWDYPTCEELGLLKVDFLGLRNLGVVDKAIKNVKKTRNIDIDLYEIIKGDMDDLKTYEMLSKGDSLGVFQLDSSGMRSLMKQLKPNTINDISALLALYRPGPMGVGAHTDYALRKNGLQEITPIHEQLKEPLADILNETYGLCIYQEQIMRIAQRVANYSLSQADNLRRAMGKKKKSVLDAEYIPFSEGMKKNGYSTEAIKSLWDVLVPFAEYGFNKSHSVGYGVLSYLTAYLKANYPSEFMSALLSSTADDTDKTALYLNDCRTLGITVSPPDINKSESDYTPTTPTQIMFGLKAIRGIGESAAEEISNLRNQKPFTSIEDFINRLPTKLANKRILEALTYGGALDGFQKSRKSIIEAIPTITETLTKARRKKTTKTKKEETSLFDETTQPENTTIQITIPDQQEYSKLEKLILERKALGLYVSGHPLEGLDLTNITAHKISDYTEEKIKPIEGWPPPGTPQRHVSGIITALTTRKTKKGDTFALGTIEDRTGTMPFIMFSKGYAAYGKLLKLDGIYQMTGISQKKEMDGITFVADSIRPLEFGETGKPSIRIKLTEQQWKNGADSLQTLLTKHQNQNGTNIIISLKTPEGTITETELPILVKPSTLLTSEIRELFGSTTIGRWIKTQ